MVKLYVNCKNCGKSFTIDINVYGQTTFACPKCGKRYIYGYDCVDEIYEVYEA